MESGRFDRASEDTGNILEIGHMNYLIADQQLATTFYISALGLTRDPAMMTGTDNMWVNVGQSQFHLPTGDAVFAPNSHTGLVVPDLEDLLARLARHGKLLEGTRFSYRETNDGVATTCPWGNRITCHAPDPGRFGNVQLGMPYVEFGVPAGGLAAVARFYREMFSAKVHMTHDGEGAEILVVDAGPGQQIRFHESDVPNVVHPTHHLQITLADFSGPYGKLKARGLICEESNRYQYRFENIVDLDTEETVFTINHEVRSMTHPMFGRLLYNRNPRQNARDYRRGHDVMAVNLA